MIEDPSYFFFMQRSPYKFLDSYSKEDRDIFFGRDKEIEELYSRVFESRILVVYGTSGTGKSSLINCGLANKFNDPDWLPVNVRRGNNINHSLFEALDKNKLTKNSSGQKEKTGTRPDDIIKLIRSIYLDHFKPVYIIFDQFEELFIFGNPREKDELINNIKKVIDSDLLCKFIFSVREEYLAGFTEFEKYIPSFLNNRIRIEKMTRLNAIQVIEGPCRLNQIEVESGFPEKLLDKLNPDSPEIELTYLQVYLDKIFRLASRNGEDVKLISADLLDRVGEVKDLLGTFLEEQLSQLDDPESGLIILKSFVSVKGTKHQMTGDEIIEYSKTFGKDIGRETVTGLIQKFVSLRILRDKDEKGKYELRHDSLATKIYEKITLVEKELLEIRQFLDNAYTSYEKRQSYLTPEDLKYIAPYEDKLFLNENLLKYISSSKREFLKARRRKQNVLITAAIILITILSAFSLWALKERSNAIEQKQFAEEQKNSAIKAKEAADLARQEAQRSQKLAVEKEQQALLAKKQSDLAKQEALAEREYALQQKNRAEKLSDIANEQAQIANNEKSKAEMERSKAITAESQARQLGLLSTAQNLALKSSGIEKNPELTGLLAVQAFNFNKNNEGHPEDPIIYDALVKAFSILDSSHHSIFKGSPNEIRILAEKNNRSILSADLDGQIRIWSPDGMVISLNNLNSKSPVNFIGSNPNGEILITQHDNNDLFLWDFRSGDLSNPSRYLLTGHNAYVSALAFSEDKKYLATAGKDSLIITWNAEEKPPSRLKTLKTAADIRTMVFCDADNLIFGTDDGSIIQWNISGERTTTLYSSPFEIPLCLAWNVNKKVLVEGCSNGSLKLFELANGKFMQTEKYIVHLAGIDLITFNSDFSLMATASWDKTVRFYEYHEFFELGNSVAGVKHIRNLNSRIRSMIFTGDNKLVAGLSDRSIRLWETSSERLATMICNLVKRDMNVIEWNDMVGPEIPYENTCRKNP